MKKCAYVLAFLLILTILPLGASAEDYAPVVTADPGTTVEVGTKVVLTVTNLDLGSVGITSTGKRTIQWYIGDPEDYPVLGSIVSASVQPIFGANGPTYEPDTSVPGVTSYFCVVFGYPSNAVVITVKDPSRPYGYVPDPDAPGFEAPAEIPAAAPVPDADANPNTGVFSFGKPHFGSECVK